MAKTHPHIDSPSSGQLAELAVERPEKLVEVYVKLHELVLEALPDVKHSVDTVDHAVGYGAHQYGYNGWGMAAVTPFGKWVSLTLLQGAKLDDPLGLLTGTSTMRHVKLSDPAKVDEHRAALHDLIIAASTLNDPTPND